MEILQASATQVSSPPRRGRSYLYAGIAQLLTALALVIYFILHPTDGLPNYPLVWIGGPLLMIATFLAVCGGYVITLRRFSLGGLLVSAVVAGLFSAAAGWYLRETAHHEERFVCNIRTLSETEFIKGFLKFASQERLESFANAVYADGWTRQIDFDHVTANIVSNSGYMYATIGFEQSRDEAKPNYLDPCPARNIVQTYYSLLVESRWPSHIKSYPDDPMRELNNRLSTLAEGLIAHVDRRRQVNIYALLRTRLEFIASRESDAALLKVLQTYIDALTAKEKAK